MCGASGKLTNALFEMGKGSRLHIRGPYGRGFPVETLKGHNLLLVAGGLGLAPLRSLLLYVLDRRSEFGDLILMYGTNNPDNVLFKYELLSFFDREDIKYLYSVDRDDEGIWKQYVGVVTGLFDRTALSPADTYAVLCGPPIMYRFVVEKLIKLGFSKEHIYMSLERMMKCGVGKCGHCAIGDMYCCTDGPVFNLYRDRAHKGGHIVMTKIPTICPFCGCGCNFYLVTEGDKVVGVEPNPEQSGE